jgi:hypothetical protein
VDELMVIGRLGEGVDTFLGYHPPVADTRLLSDLALESVEYFLHV